MDVKKFLVEAKDFLTDATIEAIEQHLDKEVEQVKEIQKNRDVYAATCAFVQLKQDDGTIYGLLSDHFGVEDISEAREYVKKARVHMQVVNLRVYCTENGMTIGEFRQYASNHALEANLKSTPRLLEMSPEKLKVYIDKR